MVTEQKLEFLGFRYFKSSSAHTARTIMLDEIRTLLFSRPPSATLEDYQEDVEIFNILHKPTENSRMYTFKPLTTLYGLTPDIFIFRVFRDLWEISEDAQPLLALQLATARDPYLYLSEKHINQMHLGHELVKSELEELIENHFPNKFSRSSIESLVRNLSSSWTQAGYLDNQGKKFRIKPKASYVNLAYALFLGYCHGLTGQRMFDSVWCRMLSQDKEHLFDLAHRASLRGLISFKQVSDIIEVTFPNLEFPDSELFELEEDSK